MVGTLANAPACAASGVGGVEHHRVMKPTTGKHWVSLAAKTHNPSSTMAGLDASDNILGPIEGAAELFFLTSPFIG